GPESPFFARCPVMGADNGGIDHLQGRRPRIALGQRLQQSRPQPGLGPALEPLVDRIPFSVALRQVAPLRASSCDPQNAVQRAPVMRRRAPATSFSSNKWLEYRPFVVRQVPATQVCLLPRGSLESRTDSLDNHFVNRP